MLSEMATERQLVVAFGNPLLDIIVNDENGELVEKYKLAKNVGQEIDTVKCGLFEDVLKK